MKTKRKIVILALTAMMLLATMLTPASTADAKAADHDRSAKLVGHTNNGGKTKPACPENTLGAPGGCYVYVSKVLVLTFDNTWMYVCPQGSVEDIFGDCRKPVADA